MIHSKVYRSPKVFANQRIVTVGNSASGHDLTAELVSTAQLPVYQSRRTPSRWDGDEPPEGTEWKPIITEFLPSGRILFDDNTYLDDIDTVIYCTGYLPSYPFWNSKNNGRDIWSYEKNRLLDAYQHTFFQDFKTLAIVGLPRVVTFRGFEYQAVALARLWSRRNVAKLPSVKEMQKWEANREEETHSNGLKFHDIRWEGGETLGWLQELYDIAGLPTLSGKGRVPPVFGPDLIWAIENVRKYPEPGKDVEKTVDDGIMETSRGEDTTVENTEWVLVDRSKKKDLLHFV